MIRPFNFYIESRKVVKQKPENNVAISLLKKAKERFGYIETQEIKDGNSFIIFENLYESLREATQSLLAIEGYKPYSHEAIIAFAFEEKIISEKDRRPIKSIKLYPLTTVLSSDESPIFLFHFFSSI